MQIIEYVYEISKLSHIYVNVMFDMCVKTIIVYDKIIDLCC